MIYKIKCLLRGIKSLFVCGEYIPHIYIDEARKTIIIADEGGFRESDNFCHRMGEKVYPNACLITSVCSCCGKVEKGFYKNYDVWKRMNDIAG